MKHLNARLLQTLLMTMLLVSLAACAGLRAPQVIKVPVLQPCVTSHPVRPVRLVGADTKARLTNTLIHLERMEQYADDLEIIVSGCP